MQMTFNGFFPPNFMLQVDLDHTPLNEEANQQALLLPGNPPDFRGVEKRSMPFLGFEACEEANASDELSDDSVAAVGEKKRRLTAEQVKALERSFELGSKLEPERKMQLARALGMKPRQIAIWFQNRRARWKTKQLEKDYEVMKREFEAMRLENEALQAHNKRLQAEILALKGRETCEPINLNKETEGSCSNRSENTSEINLDISRATHVDNPLCPQQGIPFMTPYKPANMMQLFDNSSRLEVQCPKIEHGIVQDGSFSNMFSNLDDQSAFWTLSENQNFH